MSSLTRRKISNWIRDGRAPVPASEVTSRVMSANRGKDTKPEIMLRHLLWSKGVRGYRLHPKNVIGKPDLAFVGLKIAVFVHGCFWHRCPSCDLPIPKSNPEFWRTKFEKNVARDRRYSDALRAKGWKVKTIWECEVINHGETIASSLYKLVAKARRHL